VVCGYSNNSFALQTILKMQLDLVNADCKYNNAFSLGSVCL